MTPGTHNHDQRNAELRVIMDPGARAESAVSRVFDSALGRDDGPQCAAVAAATNLSV